MSRPTHTPSGSGISFGGVRTVMVFADDPERSARWWASVLGTEVHFDAAGASVYAWVDVGDIELGFHPADPVNNPPGASPVVYWSVDNVAAVRQRLLAAGCTHHRGPLAVDDTRTICQIKDPFGTVIGLDGPAG
ncbi:VOC family protein [Streptomyces sp. NBC_01221]|uniref:VOC family protein n=1 Tax=Streptomyces sp. NBC_01221 TaxID=2903782 RepID=UPI00224E4C28|nr:VOC family protein [Streptomyces sp. NBC_01221]MCX4791920.1 VOC family protein [Streptomyces sp. NBC_01221]